MCQNTELALLLYVCVAHTHMSRIPLYVPRKLIEVKIMLIKQLGAHYDLLFFAYILLVMRIY